MKVTIPPIGCTGKYKTGGISPFVGGSGLGARSTLLGYFLNADVGWQMNGFFKGKPILYLVWGWIFNTLKIII